MQDQPDRVAISLDNRQIFLLFFASAVVLSLVFALGVVVGKRMDSRPAQAGATDPLALLDQIGSDENDDSLSYHEALRSTPGREAAAASAEPAPVPGAEPTREPAPEVAAKAKQSPTAAKPVAPLAPVKPAAAAVVAKRVVQPAALAVPSVGKDKAIKPGKTDPPEAQPKEGSYTLQLSSFQERREAEAFMEKLRQSGLKPFMIPTTIPGRGVWYRVRLGRFKSWDEAVVAKQTFEKQRQIIAYVSKS